MDGWDGLDGLRVGWGGIEHLMVLKTPSETDGVSYKWMGWIGWSPGGVKYRAA